MSSSQVRPAEAVLQGVQPRPVATVATGREKRVRKLLIAKGAFVEYPPPRVFCQKSSDLPKGLPFLAWQKSL